MDEDLQFTIAKSIEGINSSLSSVGVICRSIDEQTKVLKKIALSLDDISNSLSKMEPKQRIY